MANISGTNIPDIPSEDWASHLSADVTDFLSSYYGPDVRAGFIDIAYIIANLVLKQAVSVTDNFDNPPDSAAAKAAAVGRALASVMIGEGTLGDSSLNDVNEGNKIFTLSSSNNYTDSPEENISGALFQAQFPHSTSRLQMIVTREGIIYTRMRYGETWEAWKKVNASFDNVLDNNGILRSGTLNLESTNTELYELSETLQYEDAPIDTPFSGLLLHVPYRGSTSVIQLIFSRNGVFYCRVKTSEVWRPWIANGSDAVPPDKTLSKDGIAADALETGNRIRGLENSNFRRRGILPSGDVNNLGNTDGIWLLNRSYQYTNLPRLVSASVGGILIQGFYDYSNSQQLSDSRIQVLITNNGDVYSRLYTNRNGSPAWDNWETGIEFPLDPTLTDPTSAAQAFAVGEAIKALNLRLVALSATISLRLDDLLSDTKDYVDETVAGLLPTLDGINIPSSRIARSYLTTQDVIDDANNLRVGNIVDTVGRWEPLDGGSRRYYISDTNLMQTGGYHTEDGEMVYDVAENPLAIKIVDSNNGSSLYAIPIITDKVTAFDIGLRRGIVSAANVQEATELAIQGDYSIFDSDECIPAVNSQRLQAYIDSVPSWALDPKIDKYSRYAKMTNVYFPTGTWAFRDPVVVKYPMSFGGAYDGIMHQQSTKQVTREYPSTRILYVGGELTFVSASEASGNEPIRAIWDAKDIDDNRYYIVRQTNENLLGDEPYTSDGQEKETPFLQHACFYLTEGASVHNIEFSAWNSFDWMEAENSSWFERPSGSAYSVFKTIKRAKGVCGVSCFLPLCDDGKIMVSITHSSDGASSANVIDGATGSSSGEKGLKTGWCHIYDCEFDRFSGIALSLGKLANVDRCQFAKNWIAIQERGADIWIDDVYIEMGMHGIVTADHTTTVRGSYIDTMAGFAILSGGRHLNKSIVYDENMQKAYAEYSNFRLSGNIQGIFNCTINDCVLGAYGGIYNNNHLTISGSIKHTPKLYSTQMTRVFDVNMFRKHENLLKVYDDVVHIDSASRSPSARWNGESCSWTGNEGTETLQQFRDAHPNFYSYWNEMEKADIMLLPHYDNYADNYYNSNNPFYFGTLSQNRIENFHKLIGTAAISIGIISHFLSNVFMMPTGSNVESFVDNNGNNATFLSLPMYGFNAIRIDAMSCIGIETIAADVNSKCTMISAKVVQGNDNSNIVFSRSSQQMQTVSIDQYEDNGTIRKLNMGFGENRGDSQAVRISGYIKVSDGETKRYSNVGLPLYPGTIKIAQVFSDSGYYDGTFLLPVATIMWNPLNDSVSVRGLADYEGGIVTYVN